MRIKSVLFKSIAILFLFVSFTSEAQLTEHKYHLTGKFSLGSIDRATYQNYSLGFEWHLHKNIGINYNLDLLYRNDNFRHIHTPMGLIGGPIIVLASVFNSFGYYSLGGGSGSLWMALLIFALPDGISGHFSFRYKWDISPYANVLGIDFVKNRTNGDNWIKYACSFGSRINYSMNDHLTFTGFLETRKTAGYPFGIGGGVGIGYAFGDIEDKKNIFDKIF